MLERRRMRIAAALALAGLAACGGRTLLAEPAAAEGGSALVEVCDGLDQDGDGRVDEDFRDARGRYVDPLNCGTCGHACSDPMANASSVSCVLIGDVPQCAATSCATGFGLTASGSCTLLNDHLCSSCVADSDCGTLAGARCLPIDGESRCVRPCGDGCPDGYVCAGADHCTPAGGNCNCTANQPDFTLACVAFGVAGNCVGVAQCRSGQLSDCRAPDEVCDGEDNDCDGKIDETFVNAVSAYSLDLHNCGACGRDCSADRAAGLDLVCGGDPFAPSCVRFCPDTADGIQVGDMLDADGQLDNGCECRVSELVDQSGADASGQIDSDCDGADGSVLGSYYVSVVGDDSGPGSPTRPLRNIDTAVARAFDSLTSPQRRAHVYVASGVYTETVHMRDGVFLHGGYRGDFRAQNASGFEVVVVAPSDTTAFGGAALSAERIGNTPTVIEGISFRGRDAPAAGAPAVGIDLNQPGTSLVLRHLNVRSGRPGAGLSGSAGAAGATPLTAPTDGAAPRAAIEDDMHACILGSDNRVIGGAPGIGACDGFDVSGGAGGSATCPIFGAAESSGNNGRSGGGSLGGLGGNGGRDLSGPIVNNPACSTMVCCGLADFTVPSNFVLPGAGKTGADGGEGAPGGACSDPFGSFVFAQWTAGVATDGQDGTAGGGGGGGGAGAGVEMAFIATDCEFPDGLGGAGGGGGGGGCGGKAGRAGSSGGPAIGILIRALTRAALPVLDGVEVITHDGGAGGNGGAGGDGGQGGSGGFGGALADAKRSTPPLAGPIAGERGGKGGDGGGGGGAGGGCGGSSIGVWVTGLGAQPEVAALFQEGNVFTLGAGGAAGVGGGGPSPGAAGAAGVSIDVFVR